NGLGTTYGIAADKDGNGFWAEMSINTVVKGDFPSKESIEVKLAPVESRKAGVTPEEMKVYDKLNPTDFNMTWPWAQGPRRMGADKVDNVIWVGDSWGGNYARINPKTLETTYVPLPNPVTQQPYHITVDSKHGAWTNLWTADQIIKLDPKTNKWTSYDLPTLGTESRYISLLEQDGKMQVVVPYSRAFILSRIKKLRPERGDSSCVAPSSPLLSALLSPSPHRPRPRRRHGRCRPTISAARPNGAPATSAARAICRMPRWC